MSDNKYNGWANYETWCVNLWISDGLIDDAENMANAEEMAAYIESFVDEMNPVTGSSLFSDLMTTSLQRVDWLEIAEALKPDDGWKDDQTEDNNDDPDDDGSDDDAPAVKLEQDRAAGDGGHAFTIRAKAIAHTVEIESSISRDNVGTSRRVRYTAVKATKGWQGRVKRLINLGWLDAISDTDQPVVFNNLISLRKVDRVAGESDENTAAAAPRDPGTRYAMLYSKTPETLYGEFSHTAHFVDTWHDQTKTLCNVPCERLRASIPASRGASTCRTCYTIANA